MNLNTCFKKRINIFLYVFLAIMILLAGRLAYIQIIGNQELSEAAFKQQRVVISGIDQRGIIYDRNMVPLTGTESEYIYLFAAKSFKNEDTCERKRKEVKRIMESLGAKERGTGNPEYLMYAGGNYDEAQAEILTGDYGAFIMESRRRYGDNQAAAHIIGYINTYDNQGISGIEYEMNDLLSLTRRKVYGEAAANGALIPGKQLTWEKGISSEMKTDIVLTIDLRIQEIAEEALLESGKKGGAVVIDSKTGEILAIATAPLYNPNSVGNYIYSANEELINKCTQGEYAPGSIFKIVVAAAALENHITDKEGAPVGRDTVFHCSGKEKLEGIEIGCYTGGDEGHGSLTLEEAFAYSCNSAFIQLGKLTGGKLIIDMAERMGFGEIPLTDIPNVRSGNVTLAKNGEGDGIGNLSIGQGDMLSTPLQIVRMTNIIALSGVDMELSILKNGEELAEAAAIVTENSRITHKYGNRKVRAGIISNETADEITQMMKAAAEYGTASNIEDSIEAAGKTGSAEDYSGGEEKVHGWFTGFFPADEPQYTVSVFVENGRSGRGAAIPIFRKIADEINRL